MKPEELSSSISSIVDEAANRLDFIKEVFNRTGLNELNITNFEPGRENTTKERYENKNNIEYNLLIIGFKWHTPFWTNQKIMLFKVLSTKFFTWDMRNGSSRYFFEIDINETKFKNIRKKIATIDTAGDFLADNQRFEDRILEKLNKIRSTYQSKKDSQSGFLEKIRKLEV